MKEREQRRLPKKRESENRPTSYDNFMTQKEKDFVAFLFARTNKKKERASPDFYTQERVPMPELRKKEGAEEDVLFEGVLGMAIRKSTKKSILATEKSENSGIFIKRLISRAKIEEVYDIINRKELFLENEKEEKSKDLDLTLQKIKEIGEYLFNMDKGLSLLDRLLFIEPEKSRNEYGRTIVSILVSRIRYISYTPEFCESMGKVIPYLKTFIMLFYLSPEVLADMFVSNAAGALIGHLVLVLLKKENPQLFADVCAVLPGLLTDGLIKRMFLKIPSALIWKLLAVASKKMAVPDLLQLKARLSTQISAGLNSRSPSVIENIRTFIRRCA